MKELDNRTYPIRPDMAFQQRSWRLERTGRIVLALIIFAALAGVFFHRPASYARARNADDSMSVDHERFAHKTAMTYFTVCATAPIGDELMARLGPSFVDTHDIESIEPHPLRARGGTHGLEPVFARSAAGDVAFHIAARPKRFGTMSLHLEAEGRSSLNIRPLSDRLTRARVSAEDVLAAARHLHGLERMEDIKFAILEANGKISVIPYASPGTVATAQAS